MNTTEEQIKTLQEPCRSGQWYCNGEWHIYNDWKASRERCPKPDLLTAILAELRESRELLDAAKWIPYVNGKPDPAENTHVLITYRYNDEGEQLDVMEAVHRRNGWWEMPGEGLDLDVQVVAWMPLPQPFEVKKQGEGK